MVLVSLAPALAGAFSCHPRPLTASGWPATMQYPGGHGGHGGHGGPSIFAEKSLWRKMNGFFPSLLGVISAPM